MKKIMSLLIVCVFVVTGFTGCMANDPNGNTSNTPSTNDSVSTNETPNTDESVVANDPENTSSAEIGNSSGNIINEGIAAKQGEWVYFTSGEEIYKEKLDGSGRTLVIDDKAININVANDWIFYTTASDDVMKLYKVKTDGTGKTILNEDMSGFVNVIGDWIYFETLSDGSSNVSKMKTDGTEKTVITTDAAYSLYVLGDWIYYANRNDGDKIYKVKLDGTEKTKLSEEPASYINVYESWVYYSKPVEFKIYKIKTDGTGNVKLSDDSAYQFNVSDGWVYYSNLSKENNLFKMKLDGTEASKINDDDSNSPNIIGDWIYYYNYDISERNVYKIKTDGTGRSSAVSEVENIEDQPVTLSSIAAKTNALVGELNKTYDYAFNGGNYSIKITSIKAQDEFDDGKNKQTNVILIEFVGDEEYSHGLNFGFYNKDGNLYREEMIAIGYKNLIVYSSPDSNLTEFTKYIMISGLDADKNEGKTGVVFEVEK